MKQKAISSKFNVVLAILGPLSYVIARVLNFLNSTIVSKLSVSVFFFFASLTIEILFCYKDIASGLIALLSLLLLDIFTNLTNIFGLSIQEFILSTSLITVCLFLGLLSSRNNKRIIKIISHLIISVLSLAIYLAMRVILGKGSISDVGSLFLAYINAPVMWVLYPLSILSVSIAKQPYRKARKVNTNRENPERIKKETSVLTTPVKMGQKKSDGTIEKEADDSNETKMKFIEFPSGYSYVKPEVGKLLDYPTSNQNDEMDEERTAISKLLSDFGYNLKYLDCINGPTMTRYDFEMPNGTPLSKIKSLVPDLSYALKGKRIRIVAPVPGKKAIGFEVQRKKPEIVGFKSVYQGVQKENRLDEASVPMVLGRTIEGENISIDVSKMPHMIVAGTTGSGKSVGLNSLICSIILLKSPSEVRMILVDPKVVEFSIYDGIPHLLLPVITTPTDTVRMMNLVVEEMEKRYSLLAKYGEKNISDLNRLLAGKNKTETLASIVIIIDEFADLISYIGKPFETSISRIAAKARAVGIHLVIATQRPSADVITGTLKANLPGRISYAVASVVNSRIILDEAGAENLMGKGDLLLADPSDSQIKRIQGAFLSTDEIKTITSEIKRRNS